MPLLEWVFDMAFGGLYGALVTVVGLAAAIPYAAWLGIRRLARAIGGRRNGNASAG